jgi:transposase-like protein
MIDETLALENMVSNGASITEIADAFGITYNAARKRRKRAMKRLAAQQQDQPKTVQEAIVEDATRRKLSSELSTLRAKYAHMLEENEQIRDLLDAKTEVLATPINIQRMRSFADDDSEVCAVIVASDWHMEERVDAKSVNHLNEFNLKIAKQRIERFWSNSAKLLNLYAASSKMNQAVVALLGDFISGNIHEELLESTELAPVEAAIAVKDQIVSGLTHLLHETKIKKFKVQCHVGNHSRITKKCRSGSELGNSLELFIYSAIAEYFRNEPRIEVCIAESYHSYVKLFDTTVRFHHGHSVNYYGGVGGLTIPVNKAISQWNKGVRADLDVFGHFHQKMHGGKFIVNGSLIGYNAFALRIKAEFEPPSQTFFLVDARHGVTVHTPIFLA